MKFLRFISREKGDLVRLIRAIDEVEEVLPSYAFVRKARIRIMESIHPSAIQEERQPSLYYVFGDFIKTIQRVGKSLEIDTRIRQMIRARIFDFAEDCMGKKRFDSLEWLREWANYLFGNKRAWAIIVLVVFVFGIPYSMPSNINDLWHVTYLQALGKVFVERNGVLLEVDNEMLLQEGDRIMTDAFSTASVYFMDDSVSRLSVDTEVELVTLYTSQEKQAETIVEMDVKKGRVWASAVNLVSEKSSFTVKGMEVTGKIKNQASFDMSVQEDGVTLLASSNAVASTVKRDDQVFQKVLIEGEELQIHGGDQQKAFFSLEQNVKSDAWVQENLKKDESYKMSVQDKYQKMIKKKAGILPGHPLYMVKKLSENARVVLTFDQQDREERRFAVAEKRLLEAETLFSSGKEALGQELLGEFKEDIQNVADNLNEMNNQNLEKALTDNIQNNLAGHMKGLAVESLDSLLNDVKISLEEVSMLVLSDAVKKLDLKLRSSLDILFEARNIMRNNSQYDSVLAKFRAYRNLTEEIIQDIRNLSPEDKSMMAAALLEHKIEELMILKVLENVNTLANVRAALQQLKVNLIWDINRIILSHEIQNGLLKVLNEQKNDEFVQKTLLKELKGLIHEESLQKGIERFEKFYFSNRVIELVSVDEIIAVDFANLLLDSDTATPDAEKSILNPSTDKSENKS